MEPVDPVTASHPLAGALGRLEGAVDEALAVPLWSMTQEATTDLLTRLAAVQARCSALSLAALAHGETVDVAAPSGASNTATWWAVTSRATRVDAAAQVRLATSLETQRHRCVRDALAAGSLRVDQATVIVHAVDALPTDGPDAIAAATAARAEAWLVEQAAHHDAKALRVLGRRLFEVVAPELADAHEARRLDAEERKAAQTTRLTMSDDGHGSVFVRAKIPALQAAMLKKALLALAAPKHRAARGPADGQPTPAPTTSPERMGRAFCELLESLTDADLPGAGGTGATVVVTIDQATLTGGLKAARLDTGEAVSAGTARRLACQAGIIPAVLGSHSAVLDLGRRTRFHTRSQRIAIALRDGGCTATGCDWPPGLCHVHHDPPWSQGGPTDVAHARMLCPHHHARAHDPAYDNTKHPDGTISYHRRT